MKTIPIILVAILYLSYPVTDLNAQVQDSCAEKGQIIKFTSEKCGGCWGWTIALENDTIKTDELDGLIWGHDFKEPLAIRVTIGKMKSKLRYYEILCIRKENE